MELDLLLNFFAFGEAAVDLAAHHQTNIVFWKSRVVLFDLQDDSFVAGPSLHPQHVGLICRKRSDISCDFFRRFLIFILLEFLFFLYGADFLVAPCPNVLDRLQPLRYLLPGLLPLLMRQYAVRFFNSRTFYISLYIILRALCSFLRLLVGSI